MPGRNPPNNLPLPQPQSYEEWTAVLRTELELTESFLADTLEMGVSIERELTETKFRLAEAEILAEAEREEAKRKLAEAERKVAEGENLRKKLHNTIMELKGNIRVFCRVRPLLPSDGTVTEPVISYPTSTGALGRVGRGIDLISSGQKHPFTFDKVFNADVSQQIVFEEISQLVQSALDGYKVCIFAYGQTGSGKTYTMMGTENDEGLIPRSLEQIFKTNLLAHGWNMQVSMLEIYNDTIRDLLTTNDSSRTENSAKRQKKSAIRHAGNTLVNDLTVVDVSNEQITGLLHRASKSRSVGKTDMNEESSRSHFVLTLRMSGVNKATKQQVQGVLNLIDLAGSERVSKSRVTEDRFKETQAINKSLSSLADVIQALAKKDDYVPYRNSKLTHLLQPYLSGDSKTLMFVNISPDPSSVGESLCSLRLAARAGACEIKRNVTSGLSVLSSPSTTQRKKSAVR